MNGCLHLSGIAKDCDCCQINEDIRDLTPCFLAYGVSESHPLKKVRQHSRNEDAFVVSKRMIGVADGVSGIADEIPGCDPSDLPHELMERCKDMSFLREIDPEAFQVQVEDLLREYNVEYDDDQWTTYVLMQSWLQCQNWGATTALLVSIEQGMLSAAQYGDSCFMHLRKRGRAGSKTWQILYRSQPQTVNFACPYQLVRRPLKGLHEYNAADVDWDVKNFSSPPQSKVKPGDLIIAGSDGLFDNLHDQEIVDMVASYDVITSEELADKLFSKAAEFAGSKTKRTPWAEAAQKEFGVAPQGGKPDDITVVVAIVEHDEDETDIIPWHAGHEEDH